MTLLKHICLILFLFLYINECCSINAKGCTPLDSWSFDKVISKFNYTVVKFDTAYPYGEKHEEFTRLSSALWTNPNILVAEVGVKDYGEMENKDLADRFDLEVNDFPIVKLFIRGRENPIEFNGKKFTFANLKKFLVENSDIYIGCENCLESFDKIATKFLRTEDLEERRVLLKQAETDLGNINNPEYSISALVYVKILRKVLEKGKEAVKDERKRIDKLLKEKYMSKEKISELEAKKNILRSFTHEEL